MRVGLREGDGRARGGGREGGKSSHGVVRYDIVWYVVVVSYCSLVIQILFYHGASFFDEEASSSCAFWMSAFKNIVNKLRL